MSHEGTVRVAGSTSPRSASSCAWRFLEAGYQVDFLAIGANASHQVTKAITILSYQFNQAYGRCGALLSVVPLRFMTRTVERLAGTTVDREVDKDCSVWRVYLSKIDRLLTIEELQIEARNLPAEPCSPPLTTPSVT